MELYAGLAQVQVALRHATERLAEAFTDEAYREQQRLREREVAIRNDLLHMADAA